MDYKFIFDVKFLNNKRGNADIEINIEIPQGILARLAWADADGRDLENYISIASIPLFDGKGTYTNTNNLMIPEEAEKLRCHVYNQSLLEIELPELIIDIPAEKKLEKKKPNRVFAITSDIHAGGEYFNNTRNRLCAFKHLKRINPEFILISGDITDNSRVQDFAYAKELIETYLEGIPVFCSTGNHDLSPYFQGCYCHHDELTAFFKWQCERAEKLGAKIGEINKRYFFDAEVNGVQICVINANDEGNKFYVGEEQRNWLDECLTRSDNDRFRFVVSHFHQYATVGKHEGKEYHCFYEDNDQVQEILNKHKNIIHASGHTHTNFDIDNRNTYFDNENKLLYLNGGCAVWHGVGLDERREYYEKNRCTGQVIEVYDDYVITRGIEFVSEKFIPRCTHLSEI